MSTSATTVHVVVVLPPNASTPPTVEATPYILDLTGQASGTKTITFKIDTTGYNFPTDGTAIVFTSMGSGSQFGSVVVGANTKQATVTDIDTGGNAYAYCVTVVAPNGARYSSDPIVQNRQ